MNPSSSSLFSKRKRDLDSLDDEPRSSKRPKNEVFLNYSFEDIGNRFISHLKGALDDIGFFISDHTKLPAIGQNVELQRLKAIQESEIYVLVFTPNYASSTSSLDELLHIMDKSKERKVLPVFFDVDPSHVRNQRGPFMEAFQSYETTSENVQKWRDALNQAGQLSGLTFQNRDESKFVWEIVKELEKMRRLPLHVADHPLVGIGSRAEELISTLRLDLEDQVLVVVVFGIGGIGKTTIVKEVWNRIASSFDLSAFLEHIHYMCQAANWKIELPNKLISHLTHEDTFPIMSNHNDSVTKIIRLVSRKKTLLVLDDIDNFQQLESLGIYPKWFYEGSRIIVTTRDKRSLGTIPFEPYHTKLLNGRESLNLCTRLMFSRDDPDKTKIIKELVDHAGGIPLVLKVWSRHFQQYKTEQWPSILETLKEIPHGDVQKQLQLSYDSLTNTAKKLFLDIACFFYDQDGQADMDTVVEVLQDKDSSFFPSNEIQVLVDRSLLEIRPGPQSEKLWMHRSIREMGYEIVRQENEDEPGKRTRLWKSSDVMRVLTECSGTESVESIRRNGYEMMEEVAVEALRKMSNLRLIDLYKILSSDDEMTHLCFKKLKLMIWGGFPFKSFNNIDMGNIVILRVGHGKLEMLWEGIKNLKKLRILDVSYSLSLTKTGDFSGLENLEELYLNNCTNLKELHCSIAYLKKLAILYLHSSIPLNMTPSEIISNLRHLRKLILGDSTGGVIHPGGFLKCDADCSVELRECNTSNIPGGFGSLAWLKHLSLYKTDFCGHHDGLLQLHELHSFELDECDNIQSIPNLPRNVTFIKAWRCKSLASLPCNISELKSLTVLDFEDCPKLGTEDPDFLMKITGLTNLTYLTMCNCSVSQVPSEIGNLVSLKELDFSRNTFSSLPDSLSNLSQLVFLDICHCEKLRWLPLLPSDLTHISAWGCLSLDVKSPASIRIKAPPSKESPCSNRIVIRLPCDEVPDWCSYQSTEDILSFIAPKHLGNNICGIILCATRPFNCSYNKLFYKTYNKTKNISYCFAMYNKTKNRSCCFTMEVASDGFPTASYGSNTPSGLWMAYYRLDHTTLLVEPGDSVVLQLRRRFANIIIHRRRLVAGSSCGLRLIYESDVVDGKLVFPAATIESIPHVPLEMPASIAPLNPRSIGSYNRTLECHCYDDY